MKGGSRIRCRGLQHTPPFVRAALFDDEAHRGAAISEFAGAHLRHVNA